MNIIKLVDSINDLHVKSILDWKENGIFLNEVGILRLIEKNHSFNYSLWHAEDRARREDKGYEFVYHAKREIDLCNQKRNNKMEEIDEWMYHEFSPESIISCPLNSETPGMIIDRLSIMALKLYHMQEQAERKSATVTHKNDCMDKVKIIIAQRTNLARCLIELLEDVQNRTRTFMVYHQFKMYNDPELNPELAGSD